METLLAHSFDYLSSYEPSKVRKGLRQVEGLLAQICLSKSKQPVSEKRRSLLSFGTPQPEPKTLSDLKDDPAFREFFKLQEGFQWNVAMRLVTCLEHLLGRGRTGTNDLLILSTLDLIQGVLLLHPPSRTLFAREIYMNLLLDLLDPINCPAIQSATLLTLVTALLDHPANTRTFEELDGLLTVTSLFKQRATSREVKLKLVEFLYFYLMPETPTYPVGASAPNTAVCGLQRSPSKLGGSPYSRSLNVAGPGHGGKGHGDTRKTEEKQALLGRYLNNVEDLVEDLKETAPFGATVY
ncbi:cell division control protein 14 [Aspergillus udagawae]|uniref:Cell division control protein 14 n=1 Tax=Aspergillus udagawae TaxID=91492 RepID=A0A8H3RLW2_9EURO|nr:cell division control protein 14 [Aspergillus udagawae]GFF95711.1 cell division control protein 14 [Aspergillus udagawae]